MSQDDINQARNTVKQRQAALAYQQHHLQELDGRNLGAGDQGTGGGSSLRAGAVGTVPLRSGALHGALAPGRNGVAGEDSRRRVCSRVADRRRVGDGGNEDLLSVRVDVDEQDAWRVQTDRPATAYVRGRRIRRITLTFARLEPYVVPKTSLIVF